MYRIVLLLNEGGHALLCRGSMQRHGYQQPRFVKDPADPRINTFGTRWGALKRQRQLLNNGYDVVVVDAATGVEIDESLEERNTL